MAERLGDHEIFQRWSGRTRPWGTGDGSSIALGGDVLTSVTDEMERFLAEGHWRSERQTPTIIGCSPWLNDPALIDALRKFWQSCVVINKPEPGKAAGWRTRRLEQEGPGLSLDQFTSFESLALPVDGQPLIVGPSTDTSLERFRSVRSAGISKSGEYARVHAKMLVIGSTIESDEHPSGYPVDLSFFRPYKVWFGSANLTTNSRNSLEFGAWSDDPKLVEEVSDFLVDLLSYSEPLASTSADAAPELVPFEYDDEAMWEAMRGEDRGYDSDDE